MSDPDPNVEAMFQQVQGKLATPLTDPDEIEALRVRLAGLAERTAVLSNWKLPNSEEPFSVFSAYRPEDV